MIRIWLWEVPLPPGLQFLAAPWASALATLLFWLLVAFVLQFIVLRLIKAIARRTDSEIEDVIIDVSRRPIVLLVVLLGLLSTVDNLEVVYARDLEVVYARLEMIHRWLMAAAVIVAAYWAWRLFKEVVMHYAAAYARRSDSRVDDVLVPIMNQFVPLIILIIAGAVAIQNLGIDLSAVLVAIGGAAFIMAFALQDILSNIFSGIALLVDTPFRYGDLVRLEDGTVCQVTRIGLRVTHLYDIGEHAAIYMPNSKLANERLVNLMQPTPELVSVVPLVVGPDVQVEELRKMLADVVNGHPDLLGPIDAKLAVLPAFETLSAEKRAHGADRLRSELLVDEAVRLTLDGLYDMSLAIREVEQRGLSSAERADLRRRFEPIANAAGWLKTVGSLSDFDDLDPDAFLRHVASQLDPASLARRTWEWLGLWAGDPDLLSGEDERKLGSFWAPRVVGLLRRIDAIDRMLADRGAIERRLDEAVLRVAAWMSSEYKQPTPPWKYPSVSFGGVKDGAYSLRLVFYVDNIELEHFERQSRVQGQVRREAHRRLHLAGIPFPHVRYEGAVLGRGDGETTGDARSLLSSSPTPGGAAGL
jgi:MscS family membrane protein